MKMTLLARGAKCGDFGRRSYIRSFADAASAANSRSCCNMEFTAIAPNPTAASCNACLRVRNLFMASVLLQEPLHDCRATSRGSESIPFFIDVRACQKITMPLRRGVRTRACHVETPLDTSFCALG